MKWSLSKVIEYRAASLGHDHYAHKVGLPFSPDLSFMMGFFFTFDAFFSSHDRIM